MMKTEYMGNVLQTDVTWYVYRRVLSTDEWVQEPLQNWTAITMETALSRFKHEAYTFALASHVEYEDTKAIYLYQGTGRVAKALLDADTCQVEIWSTAIREWLSVPEQLAPKRYPIIEKTFFSKYVKQHAWINTQTVTFIRKD
jgi:hypothetical protein|tara:strand:+ start:144 stop:572 length:429 start_codon:yes stop_codon:yes gene_type:complete